MGRTVYTYSIKDSKKKLRLKQFDLTMLHVIYLFNSLNTKQIAGVMSVLSKKEIVVTNFTKKLDRYSVRGGLLQKAVLTSDNPLYRQASYTLKTGAIEVLQEIKAIKLDDVYKPNEHQKVNFHSIASKEVLICSFAAMIIRIREREEPNKKLPKINANHFLAQKNISASNNFYRFVPDAFMSIAENKEVFIELDMTTAKVHEVTAKLKNYNYYAKKNPDKDIALLFVTIDGSMQNPMTDTEHYQRLRNILWQMGARNLDAIEPNLKVFVTSLKDSGDIVADFVYDEHQNTYLDTAYRIVDDLCQREGGDYYWEGHPSLYTHRKHDISYSFVSRINRNDSQGDYEHFFVIQGHENDYRAIAKIDDFIHKVLPSKEEKYRTIIVYPDRLDKRDILLMDTYKNVLLLHRTNLKFDNFGDDEDVFYEADSLWPEKRSLMRFNK